MKIILVIVVLLRTSFTFPQDVFVNDEIQPTLGTSKSSQDSLDNEKLNHVSTINPNVQTVKDNHKVHPVKTDTLADKDTFDGCTECPPGHQPERNQKGVCSCQPCPKHTYKTETDQNKCIKCLVIDENSCDNGMSLLYNCNSTEGDGKCSYCPNDGRKYAWVDQECLLCGGQCVEGFSGLHDCRRQGYKPGWDCEYNNNARPTHSPTPAPNSKGFVVPTWAEIVFVAVLVVSVTSLLGTVWMIRRKRRSSTGRISDTGVISDTEGLLNRDQHNAESGESLLASQEEGEEEPEPEQAPLPPNPNIPEVDDVVLDHFVEPDNVPDPEPAAIPSTVLDVANATQDLPSVNNNTPVV